MKKNLEAWTPERVDLFFNVIRNFIEFDKHLIEIAIENKVSYDEIWLFWKEQRETAGITIEELK